MNVLPYERNELFSFHVIVVVVIKRGQRGKRVNLSYRPYSHPSPSKVIFSNKIQISKCYIFLVDKRISIFFFSVLRSA